MAKPWSPPRTASELPDDDKECLDILTGQLYDGAEQGRRERKLWPKRNCPPSVRRDPEMTAKFRAAVVKHDEILDDVMKRVESGEIDLTDVTEEDIIGGLRALSLDSRRPSVQLGALTRLAELKGMLKNKDRGSADDGTLDAMMEELREARKKD